MANAQGYLEAIPTYMNQFYQPYIEAGFGALSNLKKQFGDLSNTPEDVLNRIGGGYKQSPGFDFAMKQALNAATHSAAAGGMAGSPQHQQESMDVATGLASRDYDQWIQHALGLYGMGLQGEQNLYGTGFNASKDFADQLAQTLASEAGLSFASEANKNQARGGSIGGLLGGLGSLAGTFYGGPAGRKIGGTIGKSIGGFFS